VNATSSSIDSTSNPITVLWDDVIEYTKKYLTQPLAPFEYVQLDFGTCNLVFTQVIVYGEPLLDYITYYIVARAADIEVS